MVVTPNIAKAAAIILACPLHFLGTVRDELELPWRWRWRGNKMLFVVLILEGDLGEASLTQPNRKSGSP